MEDQRGLTLRNFIFTHTVHTPDSHTQTTTTTTTTNNTLIMTVHTTCLQWTYTIDMFVHQHVWYMLKSHVKVCMSVLCIHSNA